MGQRAQAGAGAQDRCNGARGYAYDRYKVANRMLTLVRYKGPMGCGWPVANTCSVVF